MKTIIFILCILFSLQLQAQNLTKEQQSDSVAIQKLVNDWHHAAAIADEVFYFNAISENGIFIGTDATELWTKKVFEEWSLKYFQKESAWDFKTISRNIYFTRKSTEIAWFDELLDTWMGTCRASGVLEKNGDKWTISHYHLSIAVPNELVKEYLKLLPKD